jgi:hypothetical protein
MGFHAEKELELAYGSITPKETPNLMAMQPLHHPQVGRSTCTHKIFSSLDSKNSKVLLFPYWEIFTHRNLLAIPLSLSTYQGIGTRDFASLMVDHWAL